MQWWLTCNSDPATQEYFIQRFASGETKICVGGCGRLIDKEDGCNFVECAGCKTQMCWVCNKKKYGEDGCNDLTHNSH